MGRRRAQQGREKNTYPRGNNYWKREKDREDKPLKRSQGGDISRRGKIPG